MISVVIAFVSLIAQCKHF